MQFKFNAFVVEFAGIHILAVDGLDNVVGIDAKQVDTVLQAARGDAMFPRQFVAPHPFGFQVGVRWRIKVHLAHGWVAESLAGHQFEFTAAQRAHHDSRLRNPLAAGNGVVVVAHSRFGSEPCEQVLSQIHVSGQFMVSFLAALFIGRFKHIAVLAVGVVGMPVDVLIVESNGKACTAPQHGALIPRNAQQCIA